MPKISQLTSGTDPAGTETVAAVQSSQTVSLTVAQLRKTLAPYDASFVTIGANATLTAERVLTAGTGISLTDGGSTATIALSSGAINVKDAAYGATGLGVVDDAPAINAALAAAASAGIGTVFLPSGTYRIASVPVYMTAGVCLLGEGDASILKQGVAANLDEVVDFTHLTATNASLRNLKVDGNRANNTSRLVSGNDNTRLTYSATIGYVTIDNCTLTGAPGYGVHAGASYRLTVSNCKFSDIETVGIFVVSIAGDYTADCRIHDNFMEDGGILLYGINNATVANNVIHGVLIGDDGTPLHVDIAGTAVTWVSGPTFATAKSGMILVAINGSVQCEIKTVNSSTSITLATTGGTHSNALASIGMNDLLGLGGISRSVITGNVLQGGASFGISLYGTSVSISSAVIANNYCYRQGKGGFVLLGGGGGAGGAGAENITIIGNMVKNCCQNRLAGNPSGGSGLHSYIITEGTINRILLDGNYAQDDSSYTYTWLSVEGLIGKVILGQSNYQIGAQNDGVYTPTTSTILQPVIATSAMIGDDVTDATYKFQIKTGANEDVEKLTGPSTYTTRGFSGTTAYWQANGGNIEFGTSSGHDCILRTNATQRVLIASTGGVTIRSDVATPANGSTDARLLLGTTAGFGIYYGSSTPSVAAAKGSIYLRSDGTQNNRMYINTDGNTAWTAFNTTS